MKMYFSSLLLLLSLAHYAQAQSSSSSSVEPTVPTGTPIPGDYSGALRPQIHYSPPIDFMVSRYRLKTELDPVSKLPADCYSWCGLLAGLAPPAFTAQGATLAWHVL